MTNLFKFAIGPLATSCLFVSVALAGPGHESHTHGAAVTHDTGDGHHVNGGHGGHAGHDHGSMETDYGRPGNPTKPAREVKIAMVETDGGMAFEPSQIAVAKGEQIKFEVVNAGELEHEIVIGTVEENDKHAAMMAENPEMKHEDANALRLAPGKDGSFIWHFTKAGIFDMSCLIPGHKEAGMTGSVTVM
ncbi:MAG: cupredoxin family protein [Filomicrobium sp.]